MLFTVAAIWTRRLPVGKWSGLVNVPRHIAYLTLPIIAMLVMWAPGAARLAQSLTFGFVTIGFALLAWQFPSAILMGAALFASLGAVGLGLLAAPISINWYATILVLVSGLYIYGGRWLAQRLPEAFGLRRAYSLSTQLVGFGLLALSTAGGFILALSDVWASVLTLTLSATLLIGCAYWYRQSAFVWLGAGLFSVPFTLAVGNSLYSYHVLQWGAWLMTAWAGLALVYLALTAVLRRIEAYVRWLAVWAHGLTLMALLGLIINYILTSGSRYSLRVFTFDTWLNIPTLIALGGAIAVHLVSAILHDGGRHPALSGWVNWLPVGVRQEIFLWPIGLLIPVWAAVAWWGTILAQSWFGSVLAGLALIYVGAGWLLAKRHTSYRFPLHVYAYLLSISGVALAWTDRLALLTTLYMAVVILAALAWIYRRTVEIALAAALLLWPFYLTLQVANVLPHAFSLAYVLLAAVGYVPSGLALDKAARKYAWPLYGVGYGVAALALIASLGGRFNFYRLNLEWVGLVVPLIVTGLMVFSFYRFRQFVFAWAAVGVFPLAFGQGLTFFKVPGDLDAFAWVGLAALYMIFERRLVINVTVGTVVDNLRGRSQAFRWPLGVGILALGGLGLALTGPQTVLAFVGFPITDYASLLLAQFGALSLVILAARLYRSRWPLYLHPPLAFVSITLLVIGYSVNLFSVSLTAVQFGLVWSVLAFVILGIAAGLDRSPVRYSHGLFVGGYAIAIWAVVWSLLYESILVWTLGLAIMMTLGSALLMHFNRHHTWEDVVRFFLGETQSATRTVMQTAFQWVTAWASPIWCVLFMHQLNLVVGFYWLGFGLAASAMLGLGVWLRRFNRAYAWPLNTASHFYIALGLTISAPTTLALLNGKFYALDYQLALPFILLQTLAVAFYAFSAWVFKHRFFAHVAAWLTFFPYTLTWVRFPGLSAAQFALAWVALAVVMLIVGFGLDRRQVRYAHGPYGFGYALLAFALIWSTAVQLVNIYTLTALMVVAVVSQVLAQRGWLGSFNDFIAFIWRTPGTLARRAAQTIFLFVAAYAFPFWLAQVMDYFEVALAWRGLNFALVAPLYIALGLSLRRIRAEYTWPLYSAGYALTAVGALLAFENEAIGIYVLLLNTVVYAASAYIFRQAFWLYLSNSLLVVIGLLTLHYNYRLTTTWASILLMVVAFGYCGVGYAFNRWLKQRTTSGMINEFALPFFVLGYLASALAMAAASGDKWLAIGIYSAAVVLYALSTALFREPLFLYPAVWLSAVPYYLLMTTTILSPDWYGVGWLPLMVVSLLLDKYVFHRTPLRGFTAVLRTVWRDDQSGSVQTLAHPALPFYLLSYALSLNMLVASRFTALIFTVALTVAAILYFASAVMFRRAFWLYPALLVTHLGLLSFFAITPADKPAQYISLPFLGLTWLVALGGYAISRRWPSAYPSDEQSIILALGQRRFNLSRLPAFHHLVMPSWSQPFFIFAALDVLLWQSAALGRYETTLIVAVGLMMLFVLFALLWTDSALTYGALALLLFAAGVRLDWASLLLSDRLALFGGLGFGLYLVGRLAERSRVQRLSVWIKPLTYLAILLTGVAVIVNIPFAFSHSFAVAGSLAFAGRLYLTIAFRGRYYRLGYSATAMLLLAWTLVLAFEQKLVEPQLYALPAGLYLMGIGYFERQRATRKLYAIEIESLGMAVLLVTSFIQSLEGGLDGLPYFILMLAEGLLTIFWGAVRHFKIPFFVGFVASVLNVIGQLIVLFFGGSTLTQWVIIGIVGLFILTAAVFVERQRTRLIAKAQEWREALEAWS
jgi:hypothetical protein